MANGPRSRVYGLTAAILVGAVIVQGCGDDDGDEQEIPAAPIAKVGALAQSAKKGEVPLAEQTLATTVERLEEGKPPPRGVDVRDGNVVVEAVLRPGERSDASEEVQDAGGDVEGSAGQTLILAEVPADQLVQLEQQPEVRFLRPPVPQNIPDQESAGDQARGSLLGEELEKTNAANWHDAGITGEGVKVGIIDSFDRASWDAAQAAGEVPEPAGEGKPFCMNNGLQCSVWDGFNEHGVAVAEIIHEMAPDAQIYIASATSVTDYAAAIDRFAAEGVRIVSRSQTSPFEGPGDGTGPGGSRTAGMPAVVDRAVANGITWFNSAGNTAGRGGESGGHWRGEWSDPNSNGWLDFAPDDEQLDLTCGFVHGLRWSDWGPDRTDYDLFFFKEGGEVAFESSENDQSAGADPVERAYCNDVGGVEVGDPAYLGVRLDAASGGADGDVLEFMTKGTVEYFSNPYSASGPVADSASPGLLSVGAVDPATGSTIAYYSSEGPTNDGRTKPDISAAACVRSFAYRPDCFNGTSSATPVAAGAGALVLSAGLASTPEELKAYLVDQAATPRGDDGEENVYGAGELVLPPPS